MIILDPIIYFIVFKFDIKPGTNFVSQMKEKCHSRIETSLWSYPLQSVLPSPLAWSSEGPDDFDQNSLEDFGEIIPNMDPNINIILKIVFMCTIF